MFGEVIMTLKEWFFGSGAMNPGFENPGINGQWGLLHIITLAICIATVIIIACVFRKKSEKARSIVLWVIVGIILLFEIARRVKNVWAMVATNTVTTNNLLYALLPRPWCAIACWSLIIARIANKKCVYNTASITALLCAIIFFAYPSAGFNNKLIEFENLYSIVSHAMLLVGSISMITLKFTDFKYKTFWKDIICLLVIFAYALIEIYVLKIADNPLYFLPIKGNEVQEILGVGNTLYVVIYTVFLIVFVNIFYLINDRKNVFRKR